MGGTQRQIGAQTMCRSPAGTCSSMKPSCILDGSGRGDALALHLN